MPAEPARFQSCLCSWCLPLGGWESGAGVGAEGKQVGVVVAVPDQGVLLCQIQLALDRRIDIGQRCAEQPFGQLLDRLVAANVLAQCLRAGLVDQAPRVALGQTDDAPQLVLTTLPSRSNQCWHSASVAGPISAAWLRMRRVSREGLNGRSSSGSSKLPGRWARGWVRSSGYDGRGFRFAARTGAPVRGCR